MAEEFVLRVRQERVNLTALRQRLEELKAERQGIPKDVTPASAKVRIQEVLDRYNEGLQAWRQRVEWDLACLRAEIRELTGKEPQ